MSSFGRGEGAGATDDSDYVSSIAEVLAGVKTCRIVRVLRRFGHVLARTHVHRYTAGSDNECMEMHMFDTESQERFHAAPSPEDTLGPELLDDDCDCVHPAAVMEARRALGDAPPAETMADLFAILGDPTRMRVLTALASGELCVSDLAVATGVNRTTISHQLRVLRAHRMVRRRRDGKVVYYALDDDHVAALLGMAAAHAREDATDEAGVDRRSA